MIRIQTNINLTGKHTDKHIEKYTDEIQTNIKTNIRINIQTHIQKKIQTIIHTDKYTDKHLDKLTDKYEPSGEGGTRSPPATLHHLQNPKWPPRATKWRTGSGKVSTPRFLGVLSNFR